jgi:hypothetical protein
VAFSEQAVIRRFACRSESVDEISLTRTPLSHHGENVVWKLVGSVGDPKNCQAFRGSPLGEIALGHQRNHAQKSEGKIPRATPRCGEVPVDEDPATIGSAHKVPGGQVVVAHDFVGPTGIAAAV